MPPPMAPAPIEFFGWLLRELTISLYLYVLLTAWAEILGGQHTPIPVQQKGGTGVAGYLNRFIDLPFPDLGGVDDNQRSIVWVKIRNPRLMTGDEVFAEVDGNVTINPETGKPTGDVKAEAVYASFARLVIAGNVWDAKSLDDDPPLIPMPPSPSDMGKMPMEILNAIGKELSKLNPK